MGLACPHSAARNRVSDARVADGPVFGHCGAALAPR